MKLFVTFLCLFVMLVVNGQQKVLSKIPKTGTNSSQFIPAGYDSLEVTRGDLNKDGLTDIVLVLAPHHEDTLSEEETPPRLLIVLFKQKGGYRYGGGSEEVVMCRHCGGVFGDPFASVSISKGILEVYHYGGSAWRWSEVRKFRFQNNGFFLIGSTSDYYWNVVDCGGEGVGGSGRKYRDVNWVTGDEEVIEQDEDCKMLKHKKQKLTRKPLVKLENFKYEE